MKMTWRMTAVLMVVLGTLSVTAVTVIGLEPSNNYPTDNKGLITWRSPSYCGGISVWETMDLGITEEEYLRAAEEAHVRHSSALLSVPVALADPDDPYVIKIADRISELTEGCDELTRATVAANFVQTGIEYVSDKEAYGVTDRWSTPLETLYLGEGDCEDSAVLLLSIYMAMGMECALLDYDRHIDTAVKVDGEWRLCYASSLTAHSLSENLAIYGETPDIYRPEDCSATVVWLSDGLAGYRQHIWELTGL